MSKSKAPTPIRNVDYDAIESALLQSARGRWFLAEYTNRNRSADTRMLLDAISRLETSILAPHKNESDDSKLRHELIEMAEAIAQTRKEIAAMRPDDEDDSRFTSATEELDAIVEATEKATSEILGAAEDIQETAWQMREQGADAEACDKLDARATDIYTACSFQDLTGQRTSKVVAVLRYLENRVSSMIEIWGLDDVKIRHNEDDDNRPDRHLLNGPARRGEGVDQDDVDKMLEKNDAPTANDAEVKVDQPSADALMDDPVMQPASSVPEEPASAAIPPSESELHAPSPDPEPPEVEAANFTQPDQLDVQHLDETKTQALIA